MQPILKYPGAKWNAANWILQYMPPHEIYLEPYFGSGAVFFNKAPSRLETINDVDGNVVNLFRVIREKPEQLAYAIAMTPWARDEYYLSYEDSDNEVEKARRWLVRCWQAFATRTGSRTGWRHSATGRSPEMPRQWAQVPGRVFEVAGRLKNAQIENADALHLIQKYNDPKCCIYVDPPYMPETRQSRIYAHEMSVEQHGTMLNALCAHQGAVVLSGYDSDLYNRRLWDWQRVERKYGTEHGTSKTEVLWIKQAG